MAEAASGGPSAGEGAGPSSMLTWKMLFGRAMAGEMSAMRSIIEIMALNGLIASPQETLAVITQRPTLRSLRLEVGEVPTGGCRYIHLQLSRRHAGAGFGRSVSNSDKGRIRCQLEVLSRSPALASAVRGHDGATECQ